MAAGLLITPNSSSYYMALMQIDLHKVVAKMLKHNGNFTRLFRGSSSSSSSSNTNKCHVRTTRRRLSFLAAAKSSTEINGVAVPIPDFIIHSSPFSGLDDVMMGYIFGKRKATEVAHLVWRHIVQKGDTLVDATCGNGYDTLAMVKMIADKSLSGHVYSLDLQNVALENTSSLLDKSLDSDEKGLVGLYPICHSKMEEVVPKGVPVRLVAFNLGYLPGGDKAIITRSKTTLLALEAAKRMLATGGLISLVAYVGHPGGREEFEAVESFASGLPVENWTCCKLQMLNRPLAPILVLLLKR